MIPRDSLRLLLIDERFIAIPLRFDGIGEESIRPPAIPLLARRKTNLELTGPP